MKAALEPQEASPNAPVYTVQRYLWPLWHDILSTADYAKAESRVESLGKRGRITVKLGR